VTPSPEFATIL